jgi:hypothetical protein
MHTRSAIGLLIALGAMPLALANDGGLYHGNRLALPRVDTLDQVGRYQDAVFELTAQGWALVSLRELG